MRGTAQRPADRGELPAARRPGRAKWLEKLGAESAYLLRLARSTQVDPAKIEASLKDVAAEEQTLRGELAQLEAQAAPARADLPKIPVKVVLVHVHPAIDGLVRVLPPGDAVPRRGQG